jgi:hypothetical protein
VHAGVVVAGETAGVRVVSSLYRHQIRSLFSAVRCLVFH